MAKALLFFWALTLILVFEWRPVVHLRTSTMSGRGALLLLATLALFAGAAAYLPLAHQGWREWSDAWFHAAVVAQINDYGIPPEDPYFIGMPLQYMWFYHIVIIALAKGLHVDPLYIPPLLNIQALFGFGLSAFLLARKMRKRFVYGYFAVLTVILALNAGVWAFLPIKLFRSMIGEIRGWDEIVRTFSLVPFEKETVRRWAIVFSSQTFLLNKFIVATAFSLGLCYMGALWYACVRYLKHPDRGGVVIIFGAVAGTLLFHTVVGVITLGGMACAAVLLWLFRNRVHGFNMRHFAIALGAAFAALIAVAPYLFSVTHLKESEHLVPLDLALRKSGSIFVSCALVLFLAAFQVKRLLAERDVSAVFLLAGTLSILFICNIIRLPAGNTYDKLPFFAFYPLAVIGSWTFADRLARNHATATYRRRIILIALLILLPINVLLTAGYYNTSEEPQMDQDEANVARWVAHETSRDAIFFDSGDRVFLSVAGPRRYYFGRNSYAVQWGYPKDEMARRRNARDNLFSNEPLSNETRQALTLIDEDVYIIARDEEPEYGGSHRLADHSDLFKEVYRSGKIAVFAVTRNTAGATAAEDS